MPDINYPYITDYIRANTIQTDPFLSELEEYAGERHIPISRPEAMRLIEILIKISGAKRILEIGTAIGYSAICMAKAAENCGVDVVSIEISEEMVDIARENIEKARLTDNIKIIHGDAGKVLTELNVEFDFIFIDAAKGQYLDYWNKCSGLCKPSGIIVSDNVLYEGMTASNDLVKRRKITIVKRLRKYVDYITNCEDFDTVILPVADGMAISRRR